MKKQYHYNEYFGFEQQKLPIYLYEYRIPHDDSVYTLKKIMEELNYSRLLDRYSHLGRKGYNPIMIYALILYANMRGIRAVDRIVDLCNRDICFIWLAQGLTPKRDVFYDFMNEKTTVGILEDLHYQFIHQLMKEGYVTLKTLFLDGTKIEANANRYTFVWRGSINYRLVNLLDQLRELYGRYNSFINQSGYKDKYHLLEEEMFIIEGSDKVKETIATNKERKRNNKKKIPNNKILKIDNICPLKLMRLYTNLKTICENENIVFVTGKGQRKLEIQKLSELLLEKGERLLKYQNAFELMNTDRNSYSKTDIEATFMRMKEDHMLNGQLKPAYNVQFGVENYFIVHTYVSNDRTDYNTLIPVIEKHKKWFEVALEEFIADSGYCSEKNLSYLKDHDIESFIKLQEHEKKKSKKYHQAVGKYYNMEVIKIDDANNRVHSYKCHNNRILNYKRTEIQRKNGFVRTFEIYACDNCDGCELKSECLYKYDEVKHINKNKEMKVNENWDALKKFSEANVLSDTGIIYRQIRSIQTEGAFGDMKHNDQILHFNHRGQEKVYKEMLFYTFGRNVNKYHRFEQKTLVKFDGKAS
jgi:transposase